MPTTDENKARNDYVTGLLKAEPTMSDSDVKYYLDKKKMAKMQGAEILKIREGLGYTVVGRARGRRVVPISETGAGTPATSEQKASTATGPVATPLAPPPPKPSTAPVSTPATVRANPTAPEKAADDQLLADLVARIQQIMERENIVHIQIPRRGEITIHESQIVKRNLNPAATELAEAPVH
jgi:hypothetical protein